MNFIKVISNLFGTKSDRDMKLIQPLVNEVIKIYPEINALSNDELRARTLILKEKIREAGKPIRTQIDELKATIEQTAIEDRKPIFESLIFCPISLYFSLNVLYFSIFSFKFVTVIFLKSFLKTF